MYGLTLEQWEVLENLAIKKLKLAGVNVWIFGSRSRGDQKKFSDIDLLYQPKTPLPDGFIYDITSNLEESSLPFKVDLVRLDELADSYKESVFADRKEL